MKDYSKYVNKLDSKYYYCPSTKTKAFFIFQIFKYTFNVG